MAGVAAAPRRAISRSIATRCNRPAVIQGCGELAGAPHPVPGHGPGGALPTHRPPCAALEGRRALPRPIVASHCIKRPNRPVGSPWGRHLGPCSHAPHPQGCSRSTTGRGRGHYTPPASRPWDARRRQGTAAWAKGHSAAPKGANGTAWPKFGTSPRTTDFRFQPGLRTNWPSLRPLRRAARVAHASRTSREGSRLPWSRHRRDGFVLDASFVPFGTVLS